MIDCETDQLDGAASFWAEALGWKPMRLRHPSDANYRRLETALTEVQALVQAVTHPSRVHLDIETNDIQAEVRRLEICGARRIAQVKWWWVMEAPTGQQFCVVRPQRKDFDAASNTWDDPTTKGASMAMSRKTARKSAKNATRRTAAKKTATRKPGAKTTAQKKVKKVMHERKAGTLRSGKSRKKVTSRKQAIAIGLSEARKAGAKVPKKKT